VTGEPKHYIPFSKKIRKKCEKNMVMLISPAVLSIVYMTLGNIAMEH